MAWSPPARKCRDCLGFSTRRLRHPQFQPHPGRHHWTADWWTWALQSPAAANPLLDATGAFADVNNDGPVFFIAGTVSGSTNRTFEVPAGKPILLPIINLFDLESVPPDPPEATLSDRERAADLVVAAFLEAVDKSSLFASIDGTLVANPSAYLEVTGYFDMGPIQFGSLLEAFGLPAGTEAFPTKSGGYWLMIDGLTPGLHELHFGGSSGDWSVDTGTPIGMESGAAFSTETTDLINVVVPEPISAALCLSWVLALLAFWRRTGLISHRHRRKVSPDIQGVPSAALGQRTETEIRAMRGDEELVTSACFSADPKCERCGHPRRWRGAHLWS